MPKAHNSPRPVAGVLCWYKTPWRLLASNIHMVRQGLRGGGICRIVVLMRSKWNILEERRVAALQKADALARELDGLNSTPCGLRCGGCDELLVTEGDFARHFFVKKFDEMNNFLNLGYCPNVDRVVG